jgi:hypothetical protein
MFVNDPVIKFLFVRPLTFQIYRSTPCSCTSPQSVLEFIDLSPTSLDKFVVLSQVMQLSIGLEGCTC